MSVRRLRGRNSYAPSALGVYRPHVSALRHMTHIMDTKAANTRVVLSGNEDIGKKTMAKLVLEEYGYTVLSIHACTMGSWDELFQMLDSVCMTRTDVHGKFFAVVLDGVVYEALTDDRLDVARRCMGRMRVPVVAVCTPSDACVIRDMFGEFVVVGVDDLTPTDIVTYTTSIFRDYFSGRCPLFSNRDIQSIVDCASGGYVVCFQQIAVFLAQYDERERNGFMRPHQVIRRADEKEDVDGDESGFDVTFAKDLGARVVRSGAYPDDDGGISAMYADIETESFCDVHDTQRPDAPPTVPDVIHQMQRTSIQAFRTSRADLSLNVVYGYFGLAALVDKMKYDARYALGMQTCMAHYGIYRHMMHHVHPDIGWTIASAHRLLSRYAPTVMDTHAGHKRSLAAAPAPAHVPVGTNSIYYMTPDEYQKYNSTSDKPPAPQQDKKPAKKTKKLVMHPNQLSLQAFMNKK